MLYLVRYGTAQDACWRLLLVPSKFTMCEEVDYSSGFEASIHQWWYWIVHLVLMPRWHTVMFARLLVLTGPACVKPQSVKRH